MYTAVHLIQDQMEYFEALEARLERPVRVLYGSGRTIDASSFHEWTDEQLEACGNPTQGDAQERGITFCSFATFGHRNSFQDVRFPIHPDHRDNMGAYVHIYDSLVVDADTIEGIVVNVQDHRQRRVRNDEGELVFPTRPLCEVQERFITFQVPFLGNYEYCHFQDLVDEAVEISLDSERFATLQEELFDRNVTRYEEYLEGNRGNPVDHIRMQIDQLLTSINTSERQLVGQRQQLRPLQAQLDSILEAMEAGTQHDAIAVQFRRLLDDPRIDRIGFSGGTVIVTTNHMNIMHPRTRQDVYLGKVQWRMHPTERYVTVTNLTNPRGGRAHPHVGTQGDPCFGDMGSEIMDRMARGDFEGAIELIFAFLASVNLNDDWGRLVRWWFDENPAPPRRYDGTIIEQEETVTA